MFALPDGHKLKQGKFQVVGKPLGQGGFAYTYKCWDTELTRYVAIKEFFPSDARSIPCIRKNVLTEPKDFTVVPRDITATEFATRRGKFLDEAKMLAGLPVHSGLVIVHEYFEENATAYLVMELLDGEDLFHRCNKKPRTVKDAVTSIRRIAEPLAFIHSKGIIHRDLNPRNVMLTGDGRVVLIDFGLSKVQRDQTQTLTAAAFRGFGPPEQWASDRGRPEPSLDIYPLSALLYFMLSGEVPMDSRDRYDHNTRADSLVPLQAYRKDVPDALSALILEGMDLAARKRPQSVAAFLTKLDAALPANPPKPAPVPAPVQAVAPQAPPGSKGGRGFPTAWLGGAGIVALIWGAANLLGGNQNGGGTPSSSTTPTPLPTVAAITPFPTSTPVPKPSPNTLAYRSQPDYVKATQAYAKKEYNTAAPILLRLLPDGDSDVQRRVGFLYVNGKGGLAKDEKEAVRLFRLSANQDDAWGQNNLGAMYANGMGGLVKDEKEAVRLYRLAAAQGNAPGQNNLGWMYVSGQGVAKDEQEAVRLYRLAADQGDARAQNNLGFMYATGRGVAKDEKEAVRLYRLAAAQGDATGQGSLGLMYASGRGVAKDEKEAVHLFRLAADQGDAAGQAYLGFMYATGQGGLVKDEKEAVRLYRLAATQGDAPGQNNLGWMYADGLGGLVKDEKEAVRLFRLAAAQGDAMGQGSLGTMYATGRGVAKDEKEAVRLYRLAAAQGDKYAQDKLKRLQEARPDLFP